MEPKLYTGPYLKEIPTDKPYALVIDEVEILENSGFGNGGWKRWWRDDEVFPTVTDQENYDWVMGVMPILFFALLPERKGYRLSWSPEWIRYAGRVFRVLIDFSIPEERRSADLEYPLNLLQNMEKEPGTFLKILPPDTILYTIQDFYPVILLEIMYRQIKAIRKDRDAIIVKIKEAIA